MEKIDPQKAARVWQRVQGQQPQTLDAQSLQELIVHTWTDMTAYQMLSRRFQGKNRQLLQQMWQQERDQLACLKGLYTLITGSRPNLRAQPPKKESTTALLRQCYGREMRRLAQYEARLQDPEYGCFFQDLAQKERLHCQNLLQLLGQIAN